MAKLKFTPGGGGENGPALRTAASTLSSRAEFPDERAMRAARNAPERDTLNATTTVPRPFPLPGLRDATPARTSAE